MPITPNAPVSLPAAPSIDDFAAAMAKGDAVYISVSGQSLQVLGTGVTPSGRSVAWVAPDVDTTSLFKDALARTYGQGIAIAVARELGLEPSPGKPLSSRVVSLALDMAQTSSQAMSGVDFATRLEFSARAAGQGFASTCRAEGIDPGKIDAAERQRIDDAMQRRFDQAAAAGQTPVAAETARAWLREILRG